MVADKGKKMKVGEKSGEEEAVQVDEALVLSIEKLQEVQDELEKINEEASEKVLDVEQKYNLLRKPVYEKRKDIIQTIPDFWSTAILAHPALGTLVTEEDHKILKYLTSLEVEDSTDVKSGYSITFNFKSNPFFEDEKLTKTFSFHDEGTTEIIATPIKWKEGMPNGVAHEKKGNKRPLDDDSFFGWFSNNKQKGTLDEMQDEVAEIIKEDLWPNPLAYFNTDDADEEDLDGEEGDEGDKDGDDSEEDDEEQDDDDEDEEGEGDDEGN